MGDKLCNFKLKKECKVIQCCDSEIDEIRKRTSENKLYKTI